MYYRTIQPYGDIPKVQQINKQSSSLRRIREYVEVASADGSVVAFVGRDCAVGSDHKHIVAHGFNGPTDFGRIMLRPKRVLVKTEGNPLMLCVSKKCRRLGNLDHIHKERQCGHGYLCQSHKTGNRV